jgi:hypothetical protein
VISPLGGAGNLCEGDTFSFSTITNKPGNWLFESGLQLISAQLDPVTQKPIGGIFAVAQGTVDSVRAFSIRLSEYGLCQEFSTDTLVVFEDDKPTFDYLSSILGFGKYCADELENGPINLQPTGGVFEINPDLNLSDPWMSINPANGIISVDTSLIPDSVPSGGLSSYQLSIRYITNEVCLDTIEKSLVVFPKVTPPEIDLNPATPSLWT